MRLVKNSNYPADPFQALGSWFNPSFNEIFDWPATARQAMKNFGVDLYEDAENYYVVAELPGVKKDEIGVSADDQVLTISVDSKTNDDDGQTEEASTRSVRFDELVALDKTKAKYEDGVLTVSVPKTQNAKPRQIAVS